MGAAWEWTSTEFAAYPGFRAHPYPEYSEVFFARGYRVLRGGSWATDPLSCHPDVPQLGPTPAPPDLQRRPTRKGRCDGTGHCDTGVGTSTACWPTAHERTLADDVLDGLTRPLKELPPKHFYDARGSELFDAICELPEYYPTRTERAILDALRRRDRRR